MHSRAVAARLMRPEAPQTRLRRGLGWHDALYLMGVGLVVLGCILLAVRHQSHSYVKSMQDTEGSHHCQTWWDRTAQSWASETYKDGRGSPGHGCGLSRDLIGTENARQASMVVDAAVCISGQLRTFEQVLPSLKQNVLGRFNDVHIYAVVTTSQEADLLQKHLSPRLLLIRDQPQHTMSERQVVHDQEGGASTQSILDTVGYSYALPENKLAATTAGGPQLQFWLKQLEGLALCNELRHFYQNKHGVEYRWVVRARWDTLFPKRKLHELMNPHTISLPSQHAHGGFNDKFAVGPPELMDHYFTQLDAVYHRNTSLKPYQAETFLQEHLQGIGRKHGAIRVLQVDNPVYILRPDRSFSQT